MEQCSPRKDVALSRRMQWMTAENSAARRSIRKTIQAGLLGLTLTGCQSMEMTDAGFKPSANPVTVDRVTRGDSIGVGYAVIEARDGEEGVARATEELPDLILMDISIPGIDGWEATRRLKAQESTRDIPIIALTAHALEEDREKAREVGCDGSLAKPVELRRVVEAVQRFLGVPDA